MKKFFAILCCIMILFCVAACGKESELEELSTESVSESSYTLLSTKPQQPYWDTHEPLSYAGLYNGQRFSGDYTIERGGESREGDVYFSYPRLVGKLEDKNQPFSAKQEYFTDPFLDVYYDRKNNRYIDARQMGVLRHEDGYMEFDFKTNTYYYNDTSCKIPGSEEWSYIEADDEYVVYVDGPKKAEEENKPHVRIYWKKNAGLLGFYYYYPNPDGEASVINIRFTSKTARGWNMAETIVPNALPGAKRVWPEKLWPAEYKGLNDPELRAILEEY